MNTDTGVLVVNDESTHGTIITSRQSGESELRKTSIPVFCHDDIQAGLVTLRLSISFRGSFQDAYYRNWQAYCSERVAARAQYNDRPTHIYRTPQTYLESERLTLMNQFYQGSGKTVSKAVDHQGNFHAVKQLGKHLHREIKHLSGLKHVCNP